MNNPFEHELIRKYFHCKHGEHCGCVEDCTGIDADAILKAMTEPIKDGEKYLQLEGDGSITQRTSEDGEVLNWVGCFIRLRLPSEFQTDTVEEQIEKKKAQIIGHAHAAVCNALMKEGSTMMPEIKEALDDLVRLVESRARGEQ